MGFIEHLQSEISVNYFLKSILSSPSPSTMSYGARGGKSSELDSMLLFEQALKIDEVINCIKLCSLKIALFWQLVASETVTVD
jgi:hypothetical protein